MIEITYEEIATPELSAGAILHTHPPFEKDYLALHCLLRRYQPKSVLEIGTHIGEGTKIICNSVPEARVHTLDLPVEESGKTLQHPILKNKEVGELCNLCYNQLLGDSLTFDYSSHPCGAWFIDGEHDYAHPRHETKEAIRTGAKLIIYHDADMQEVANAINDSFVYNNDYDLYRVTGTRIAYAIIK